VKFSQINPTRFAWVRWVLMWLAVVWMLGSSVLIVVTLSQHNGDLQRISALQQRYGAEQHALVQAGREQAAFAGWLIVAIDDLCTAEHVSCPPLPTLPGVKP
jgi:hypothetical protein